MNNKNYKSSLTSKEKEEIKSFLLGAAFAWKKTHENEYFTLQNLMGGANFYWNDTPAMKIYQMYTINYGLENASLEDREEINNACIKAAGKYAGRLLAQVMREKNELFISSRNGWSNCYKWKN